MDASVVACDRNSPEFLDEVRLALTPGVGPKWRQRLLDHFGSAAAVFNATLGDLSAVPSMQKRLAEAVVRARREVDAEREIERCARQGVEILLDRDPRYPRLLKECQQPPGILFVRGEFKPEDAASVAIVGSRHGTRYGLQQAEKFAGTLARAGLTIVSGLARGVDGAAHRAAIDAGGRTIAVLGGGLGKIYPPEHRGLADDVAEHGAVISEAPLDAEPKSGMFPQRNRIISGLSLGIVVVQAALRSGALSTAQHAAEQGREVFAVPGPVDDPMSRGCHRLIRDGVRLVESAQDVLEDLGVLRSFRRSSLEPRESPEPSRAEPLLDDAEAAVYRLIAGPAVSIDEVMRDSQLPAHEALAAIGMLEMRRLIKRLEGSRVQRV
ncbi:MAG TPA: DNA-processing protein DprA [Pirellulales bacterium]